MYWTFNYKWCQVVQARVGEKLKSITSDVLNGPKKIKNCDEKEPDVPSTEKEIGHSIGDKNIARDLPQLNFTGATNFTVNFNLK